MCPPFWRCCNQVYDIIDFWSPSYSTMVDLGSIVLSQPISVDLHGLIEIHALNKINLKGYQSLKEVANSYYIL